MINGKRIAVVLPAYNAEKTLEATVARTARSGGHHASWSTTTAPTAPSKWRERLGLQVFVHDRNYGYGRNQQTCYREALAAGADVVIMVHPGLSVHAAAGDGDGQHGGVRRVRRGAGIAHYRRPGAARRHAALEIHFQPLPDRIRKSCSCGSSSRNITPGIAPSAAKC